MNNPDYLLPVDDGLPFRDSGLWAEEKLDYINRYVSAFSTAMREKPWRRRYYIDLFAGPGKCQIRKSNNIFLGSPLLALTVDHPFTHYKFVELDPDLASALISRSTAHTRSDAVDVISGDANTVVIQIADEIQAVDRVFVEGAWSCISLTILDPEGLELHWTSVQKLAKIKAGDMLFSFPIGGLRRTMPKAIEKEVETPVDKFFGNRKWREIYKKHREEKIIPLSRELLDLYREGLSNLGYQTLIDQERGDEILIRNARRRAPLYYMLFASKHQRGHEIWHSIIGRDQYGQKRLFDK